MLSEVTDCNLMFEHVWFNSDDNSTVLISGAVCYEYYWTHDRMDNLSARYGVIAGVCRSEKRKRRRRKLKRHE